MNVDRRSGRLKGQEGSILLPVILLLLLLATAASAMTLQARASLREASTRRLRATLGVSAEAAVRATALALASATAARTAPPFPINGVPTSCRFGNGRLELSVQDEGGRVDLNKAAPELLLLVLTRAGLSAPDAKAVTEVVVARRDPNGVSQPIAQRGTPPVRRSAAPQTPFATIGEIDGMPGVEPGRVDTLLPLFTVSNGSTGIDPGVAAPAIRALIPPKELSSPAMESITTPSAHSDFTITATAGVDGGPRVARQASLHFDPQSGPMGHFTGWEAPNALGPAPPSDDGPFCRRLAAALSP